MIKSLIKPLINTESKFGGQSGIRIHRYITLIEKSQPVRLLTLVPIMCGTRDQRILILDH